MKTRTLITLIGALMLAGALHAGQVKSSSSSLWLEGDSTMHPYKAVTDQVAVEGAIQDGLADLLKKSAPLAMTMTVEVKTLKSGKDGLDKNMYKYLLEKDNPNITFVTSRYEAKAEGGKPPTGEILLFGSLRVAGVAKDISVAAKAVVEDGSLKLTGNKDLLMTDFDIKPPKMMMGMIKCGNEIAIGFELDLTLEDAK